MPCPCIGVGTRVSVGTIGETAVAVIKIAARIADEVIVLHHMPHVAIVGETIAKDDDLAKDWRTLRPTARHRNEQQDQKREKARPKRWKSDYSHEGWHVCSGRIVSAEADGRKFT